MSLHAASYWSCVLVCSYTKYWPVALSSVMLHNDVLWFSLLIPATYSVQSDVSPDLLSSNLLLVIKIDI
jgi:hypothetical protein